MKLEYKKALIDDSHIAYQTLDKLVKEAKDKEIFAISLEATDMGRPLYEKYGFVKMEYEMEYEMERI